MATFYQLRRVDDLQPWDRSYSHRYVMVHRGFKDGPAARFLVVSYPMYVPWELRSYHDAMQFEVYTPSDIMDIAHQVDRVNVYEGWKEL